MIICTDIIVFENVTYLYLNCFYYYIFAINLFVLFSILVKYHVLVCFYLHIKLFIKYSWDIFFCSFFFEGGGIEYGMCKSFWLIVDFVFK